MPKGSELYILILIALLLFGGKRLPDLARGVGRSMRIFKSELKATDDPKDDKTDDSSSAK